MMKLALGLGLFLALIGCQTVFKPWLLSEISTGMSSEQVIEKLGEPTSIVSRETAKVFVYTYTEPIKLQSEFPYGKPSLIVTLLFSPIGLMKQYQYELIFIENALINYKEIR